MFFSLICEDDYQWRSRQESLNINVEKKKETTRHHLLFENSLMRNLEFIK